jgi:PAS domain S-box-containing protein
VPTVPSNNATQALIRVTGSTLDRDELQRLVRLYETILANTDDFVYIFDPQGRFLYANARLLKVWAKSLDQIVGKTCLELGYPDWHAEMHMREVQQIVRDKQAIRNQVFFTGDSGISGQYDYILKPVLNAAGEVDMIVGTTRDVTDAARAHAELRAAEEALRQANAQLADRAAQLENLVQQRTHKLSDIIGELEAFSYSISHDLRSPLRSMIGFSDILLEDYAPKLDAEGAGFLQRIGLAGRRMDRLIQDVLNFSRLSSSEIDLGPVNSDALLRDVIRSYPNLQAARVTITIEPGLPHVRANEGLLTQCVANLLENAVKFVPAGQQSLVNVTARSESGRTRLYFADNGIGIPEHSLGRIFDIFQRVGRDTEGTGIGLAIVRRATEKMGGTVGVQSELGKGSVFWLDLEFAVDPGAAAATTPALEPAPPTSFTI